MKTIEKQDKKKKYGFCSQIADIVGSSRFYVSQVLSNPEGHNGDTAILIKQTAEKLNVQNAEMKSAIALQSQN